MTFREIYGIIYIEDEKRRFFFCVVYWEEVYLYVEERIRKFGRHNLRKDENIGGNQNEKDQLTKPGKG